MGRKLAEGSVPILWRGDRSPSSTMWPGPRPTSVPSAILIHPAVWPGPSSTYIPSGILIRPAIWPQQIWADVFNVFGRPFVKRFALCYQTVVCLYVLSCPVCDVRALWPNGRIKIKLGTHVGLGPGHIVLDGDWGPAPPPPKGHSPRPIFGPNFRPQFSAAIFGPNFRPISVAAKWLNG